MFESAVNLQSSKKRPSRANGVPMISGISQA